MEINIPDQIDRLKRLQVVASQIFEITEERSLIPAKIQEIEEKINAQKDGLNQAEEDLKQMKVHKNEKETDLVALEEKILKHDGALAQIKTNKEYSAMLDQINSLKADVSKAEESILLFFDEIEEGNTNVSAEKAKFEESKKVIEAEISQFKAKDKALEAALADLIRTREEIASIVKPEYLALYEKILKGRGKTALSKVEGDYCTECNLTMRPQIINEVKKLKKLVTCEMCKRILYTEE
jgi:uncharacterized protein